MTDFNITANLPPLAEGAGLARTPFVTFRHERLPADIRMTRVVVGIRRDVLRYSRHAYDEFESEESVANGKCSNVR